MLTVKKAILLSAVAIILIASCKTTKTGTGAISITGDTISDYSFHKVTRDKELYAATKEMVPIDTAYLTRDTLHIITKKILGCDSRSFKLFWNGAIQKSLPPQTNVKLFQQVDAECKKQHLFHLTYNISTIRPQHDTASFCIDSCAAKSTRLHIGGYKGTVLYEY